MLGAFSVGGADIPAQGESIFRYQCSEEAEFIRNTQDQLSNLYAKTSIHNADTAEQPTFPHPGSACSDLVLKCLFLRSARPGKTDEWDRQP